MLQEQEFDYFKIENYFKESDNVVSNLIMGSKTQDVHKITFSIPTYKRSRTLKETIESILSQDYDYDIEIIVIDNNPERGDETEIMMRQYEGINNLKYYKNSSNVGMAGNWNKCFSIPASKWVVLLHDDDMIRPDYLRNIIPCLNDKVDALFPQLEVFNDGEPIPEYNPSGQILIKRKKLRDLFLSNNPPSGIIMRREKVRDLGGFTNKNFAPDIFLIKMIYYAKTYTLQKKIVLYRKGINESTKFDAMDKMCTLNYFFREQAWPKMGIPKFIASLALPNCHLTYENMFRQGFNDAYRYSLMPKYSERELTTAKYICKFYDWYFRICRKLFRHYKKLNVIKND